MRTNELENVLGDKGYRGISPSSVYGCKETTPDNKYVYDGKSGIWLHPIFANSQDGCDFSEVEKFYAETERIITLATAQDLKYLSEQFDNISREKLGFEGVVENAVDLSPISGIGTKYFSETHKIQQVIPMLDSLRFYKNMLRVYAKMMEIKSEEVMEEMKGIIKLQQFPTSSVRTIRLKSKKSRSTLKP